MHFDTEWTISQRLALWNLYPYCSLFKGFHLHVSLSCCTKSGATTVISQMTVEEDADGRSRAHMK